MTRGEAITTVAETLVNVMAGRAVWVEDGSPLYEALLLLANDEAAHYSRLHGYLVAAGLRRKEPKKRPERGYHDDDGWSVRVR